MDENDGPGKSEPPNCGDLATTNPTNELINLDDLELSDEDTWLYTPLKTLSSEEKGLSPYKWLRQDIEDPNNKELQMAKTALVSKLDELDILKSVRKPLFLETVQQPTDSQDNGSNLAESPALNNCDKPEDFSIANNLKDEEAKINGTESPPSGPQPMISDSKVKSEVKPLNDVTDVFERARQQEESLKQSSSRFFSQSVRTLPRSKGSMPSSASLASSRLTKPASVEGLHMYGGRSNSASSPTKVILHPRTVICSPNVSPYSSMISLNLVNDIHRSSLPNLNEAQRSLKSRKNKKPTEQKIQCPLPVYPKSNVNSGMNEATQVFTPKSSARLPPQGFSRESQTLPSSFRTKSRRSLNEAAFHSTLSRHDSDPQSTTLCQKNSLKAQVARRGSMPTGLNGGRYNSKSSLSSCNKAPHQEHGSFLKLNGSRSGSVNPLMPEFKKEIPIKGVASYPQRCSSNSPVKRQPLISVHNRSSNGDNAISNNCSLRKPSLSSKIPSPASRSGIPVPSQFIDRAGSCNTDDNWSQDSY